jgi:hypothetical protein
MYTHRSLRIGTMTPAPRGRQDRTCPMITPVLTRDPSLPALVSVLFPYFVLPSWNFICTLSFTVRTFCVLYPNVILPGPYSLSCEHCLARTNAYRLAWTRLLHTDPYLLACRRSPSWPPPPFAGRGYDPSTVLTLTFADFCALYLYLCGLMRTIALFPVIALKQCYL